MFYPVYFCHNKHFFNVIDDEHLDKNDPVMMMESTNKCFSFDKKADALNDLDIGSYEKFITNNVSKSTSQGKTSFPTPAQLISKAKFGQLDLNHQFYLQIHFDHSLIFLIKFKILDEKSMYNSKAVHPLYAHLFLTIESTENLDFSSIAKYDEHYKRYLLRKS